MALHAQSIWTRSLLQWVHTVFSTSGSSELPEMFLSLLPLLLPHRPVWCFRLQAPQAPAISPRDPRLRHTLPHRPAHLNGGEVQRDRRGSRGALTARCRCRFNPLGAMVAKL